MGSYFSCKKMFEFGEYTFNFGVEKCLWISKSSTIIHMLLQTLRLHNRSIGIITTDQLVVTVVNKVEILGNLAGICSQLNWSGEFNII
jgi:hypothetical protein